MIQLCMVKRGLRQLALIGLLMVSISSLGLSEFTTLKQADAFSAEAARPATCSAAPWEATATYSGDSEVSHQGKLWTARWWTTGEEPGTSASWGVWDARETCGNGEDVMKAVGSNLNPIPHLTILLAHRLPVCTVR